MPANILQYVLSLYVLDLTGSATLRMIGIASGAAGEMFFGLLNDATWVRLPIFLGAAGVDFAALLFRYTARRLLPRRQSWTISRAEAAFFSTSI